jgi:putative ABC transport system substrate-binding protein
LFGGHAFAHDILVIQSLRVKPFDEALRGFASTCKAGSKKVVYADTEGIDIIKTVREEKPKMILAIGADALARIRKIKDIPIVYLMVLNPQKITGGKNITGVSMNVPAGKYLALVEKLPLRRKRIGVLYDPDNSGYLVRKAQQAAGAAGVEIVAREVRDPKDVPALLSKLQESVDLIWMVPDATVVTPVTVEFLLDFSQQHRIPIVTFAGKYVDMGALLSPDIDNVDLGRQAGELALKILDGTSVDEIPRADARKTVLKINRSVAKKLGISLDGVE